MKDVAFVIVLVLAAIVLAVLTLMQAASKSLKVALFLSLFMGLMLSFLVAMIAFTVDENLDSDAMYKIMLISQLASGFVSWMMMLQPCFVPYKWQRNMTEGIQNFLDRISGDISMDKSILSSLKSSSKHHRSHQHSSFLQMQHHNSNSSSSHSMGHIGGINVANVSYSEESGKLLLGDISQY